MAILKVVGGDREAPADKGREFKTAERDTTAGFGAHPENRKEFTDRDFLHVLSFDGPGG